MKGSMESGWWSNQKRIAIIVLLLAAVLTVLYKMGDSYILDHLIVNPDKTLALMVYMTYGSVVGLAINLVLCQTPLGKIVDKSFTSIRGVSRAAHWQAFVSGIFGSLMTLIYLWGFQRLDPSILVPFTSLVIVYLMLFEAMIGRFPIGKMIFPVAMTVAGVAITSYSQQAKWQEVTVPLLVLLIGYNAVAAIGELAGKKGVDESDAISFGFWRFFWLAVCAVGTAVGYSILAGQFLTYLAMLYGFAKVLPIVVVVMLVVFFGNAWANRGLALSNATMKNIIMSLQTVLAVILTALANAIWPGMFGGAPATVVDWLIRLVGAALMMAGVIRLYAQQ